MTIEERNDVIELETELLAAIKLLLRDYRTDGCPQDAWGCTVCQRSRLAKAAALLAIEHAEHPL